MRRIIINIADEEISDERATEMVSMIVKNGKVSETASRKHY